MQQHATIHARVVAAMFESRLGDQLLRAAGSTDNAELHIHVAELIVLCCDGQDMVDVALALTKTRTKEMRRVQSDAMKQTLARVTAARAVQTARIKHR